MGTEFVRVKHKVTGHEYSVRTPGTDETVINKPAVDRYDRPLRPKPKTTASAQAAAKRSDTPTDTPDGDEPAATPKEGSSK